MKNAYITITYMLADGQTAQIQVAPEVAAGIEKFKLKEQALQKQDRRYLDRHGYTEGETEHYISHRQEGVDDIVERMDEYERLHQAIIRLPETQRNRVRAYYFEGRTIEEIADIEDAFHQSVSRSIRAGIKNLKKYIF